MFCNIRDDATLSNGCVARLRPLYLIIICLRGSHNMTEGFYAVANHHIHSKTASSQS